mmetsp:Transcript_12316/g.29028  ORF Transcript_12316/g.29028 Transcript_12316/m.29028 type:complete len:209 (-) Transcript_12316:1169-1795(-)
MKGIHKVIARQRRHRRCRSSCRAIPSYFANLVHALRAIFFHVDAREPIVRLFQSGAARVMKSSRTATIWMAVLVGALTRVQRRGDLTTGKHASATAGNIFKFATTTDTSAGGRSNMSTSCCCRVGRTASLPFLTCSYRPTRHLDESFYASTLFPVSTRSRWLQFVSKALLWELGLVTLVALFQYRRSRCPVVPASNFPRPPLRLIKTI